MMRNWKVLALCTAVTVTLSTPAIVTAGGSPDEKVTPLDKMERKLLDALKKLDDEVQWLKGESLIGKTRYQNTQDKLDKAHEKLEQLATDVSKVQTDLGQLRAELNDVKKRFSTSTQALYPPPNDKATLDEIKGRLGKIEEDLAKLGTAARVALSPPAASGRLQLVNSYSEDLLFIVNGRAYRLAPGMTQMVDQVPAGAFTYEVVSPSWGLRARNSPLLASGETFTITAR
jgi:hypothetical protein